MSNISLDSDDSDVFYVEQSSTEPSPRRHKTPNLLNSTELSQHHTVRIPSLSSIASPQPQIFTIDDDSNEITMPYGFGQQLPIVPPSLNDLNLPPNPFNILATMAVVHQTQNTHDDNYSPQSPEPSELSSISISTRPMNVSAFNSWENHIPALTTIPFIPAVSLDESIGIFRQMMILALVFQGIHLLCRALLLLRRLQEHRKES